MNTHFEIRIRVGVFYPPNYSITSRIKKFDDEKQARECFVELQRNALEETLKNDDTLYDFLQENFGHEEFDVCNLHIDGLFKITEEKL